jgi:hypothetical protein
MPDGADASLAPAGIGGNAAAPAPVHDFVNTAG